jgi:hypothetical protein
VLVTWVKEIARLNEILGSDALIMKIIRDELLALKDEYGDARRTEIVAQTSEIGIEDLIKDFTYTPLPLLILAGLGVATLCGLWNGILVSRLNIQPLVATLVLMVAGRGIAQLRDGCDLILIDTAGRHKDERALVEEMEALAATLAASIVVSSTPQESGWLKTALATMPSREVLFGQVLGGIQGTATHLGAVIHHAIQQVLEEHTKELMSIPGVAGMAQALRQNRA